MIHSVDQDVFIEILPEILKKLTPRLRYVLKARFGFEGKKETQVTIGKTLGVSAETIRRCEEQILRYIRLYVNKASRGDYSWMDGKVNAQLKKNDEYRKQRSNYGNGCK